MSHYALYTQYTALAGKSRDLVDVLKKLDGIVSSASGCRVHVINQEAADEDNIWVTEIWESEEAYAISLTLDGAKELGTEAAALLAQPARQLVLEAIAGKGL